jgi:hypothetical protein
VDSPVAECINHTLESPTEPLQEQLKRLSGSVALMTGGNAMLRKTWGPFTGTQLTMMFIALMLVMAPGTLWAVAAYTNVAIQDPVTGKKSYVDKGRRLWVYNPITGADEVVSQFVRFFGAAPSSCSALASPSPGKALVVKSIRTDHYADNQSGLDLVLRVGSSCSSNPVASVTSGDSKAIQQYFEPGIVVPPGQSLWFFKTTSDRFIYVYGTGYLVPAAWAPASASYDVSASPVSAEEMPRQRRGG